MALGSILPAPYLQIETLPSIMRTLSCHKQSFQGRPIEPMLACSAFLLRGETNVEDQTL